MDYVAEIDKVLKNLQELTIITNYGNLKKLTNSMETLVSIANELKRMPTAETKEEEEI